MEQLVAGHASVICTDNLCRTPLHLATLNGSMRCVNYLIKEGYVE